MTREVTPIRFTFKKSEKLCSKKIIAGLHESGFFVSKFPLRINYVFLENQVMPWPAQAMVSVSKRRFKKAVDRNRIKRMLREIYRHRKHELYACLKDNHKQVAIGIIYTGTQMIEFWDLEKAFHKVYIRLIQAIQSASDLANGSQNKVNE